MPPLSDDYVSRSWLKRRVRVIKHFHINLPGETRTIRAYDIGVPGLIVCRTLTGSGWGVVHAASGATVHLIPYGLRDEACALAEVIGPLADWTLPLAELRHNVGLLQKVRDIGFEVAGLQPMPGETAVDLEEPYEDTEAALIEAFNATVIADDGAEELDLALQADFVHSWNTQVGGIERGTS